VSAKGQSLQDPKSRQRQAFFEIVGPPRGDAQQFNGPTGAERPGQPTFTSEAVLVFIITGVLNYVGLR